MLFHGGLVAIVQLTIAPLKLMTSTLQTLQLIVNSIFWCLFIDRRVADKYIPSTWTIKFLLNSIKNGIYKLRLAIASANRSDLQVKIAKLTGKKKHKTLKYFRKC